MGLQAHSARQLEVGHVEIDPESRYDVVIAMKHLQRFLQQLQHLVDALDSDGVDFDKEIFHQFVNGLSVRLRKWRDMKSHLVKKGNGHYLEVARVALPSRVWVERIRGQNGAALAPEARRRPDEGLVLGGVATPRAAAVEVPARREPLPP